MPLSQRRLHDVLLCFGLVLAGNAVAQTAAAEVVARGAYLARAGDCVSCHSPRNALGGIEKDKAYTGVTVDGWFALKLSSELHTGLGSRTVEQIATYLKDIPANSTLRQGKPAPDPTRAAGASPYLDHCAGCQQAGGRGLRGVFPPLAGNGVVLSSDPSDILKVVLHDVLAQGK